jgi:putative SOS response-associated peptidase YedK
MCGRYALYGPKSRSRAQEEYFSTVDQFPGSWNVAPTHMQPITRMHDGKLEQVMARWGLIPYWAKDEKIGFKCINARAETVATTPAFRGAYKAGQRCLVPASGFFEWETRPDGKQPFYFTSPEGSLLAFAGLWDNWRKPDGTSLLTFTIVTTEPNDFVARFHDRMPGVLDERDYGRWLDGSQDARDLLKACHNEALYNFPVSRLVNSVRDNDASLIEPVPA